MAHITHCPQERKGQKRGRRGEECSQNEASIMQQLCLDFMGKLCGAWLSRQTERETDRETGKQRDRGEREEKCTPDRARAPCRVSRKSAKLGWLMTQFSR